MSTHLPGGKPFRSTHTAVHIAAEMTMLMAEWRLGNKMCCIVDTASNMSAAANSLDMCHCKCFEPCLYVPVRNTKEAPPGLEKGAISRRIVPYFSCSANAKERLGQVQQFLGCRVKNPSLEVSTRYNSTHEMLKCLYDEEDAVATASVSNSDQTPLTSQQHESTGE